MATETSNLPEQLHQRPGNDVVRRDYGGTDSPALDASDILIPRMKVGQKTSRVVDDDAGLFGAIYVLPSRDADPEVMATAPTEKGKVGDPVRFYIHADPIKGWSWTTPSKELGRSRPDPRTGIAPYPSLDLVRDRDPKQVYRTYDYLVTLPAYEMLPVKFLMHGAWGGQAAKQINTQLLLNRNRGVEGHTVAYELRARKTASPQGGQERPYTQVVVGLAKVAAKDRARDLELVEAHIALVGSSAAIRTVEEDDTGNSSQPASDAPSLD